MLLYTIISNKCISVIGHSRPTHKQLQNIVIPKVASIWYKLGTELYKESDMPKLETFKKDHLNDNTVACTEMLNFWLQAYGDAATWHKLTEALEAPGIQMDTSAHEIKKEILKS